MLQEQEHCDADVADESSPDPGFANLMAPVDGDQCAPPSHLLFSEEEEVEGKEDTQGISTGVSDLGATRDGTNAAKPQQNCEPPHGSNKFTDNHPQLLRSYRRLK